MPKYDLLVLQENRGLKIEQSGLAYLAKNWELSKEVLSVFDLAFSYNLTCLIRRGHPRETKFYETGETVDYIGFSLSPEHYWVFVLDMDSCLGSGLRSKPRSIKFRKIYRHILRGKGIECSAEWRTPQNLHVDIEELGDALKCISPYVEKLGLMKGARLRRGEYPFFVDEEDLHSFLLSSWTKCSLSKRLGILASKFILNNIAHREGEIDLLAEDHDKNLFVIELKDSAKNGSGETPTQQLQRYMEHPDIVQKAENRDRKIFGILIAQDLSIDVRRDIKNSDLPVISYEITKTEDGVDLEEMSRSLSAGG